MDHLARQEPSCYVLRVFAWLRKLICRSASPARDEEPPRWAIALLAEHRRAPNGEDEADEGEEEPAEPEAPPPWAIELLESVQRAARAQGKAGLRLEQIEHKLDEGLVDLQRRLAALTPPPPPRWDDLLDAMDLLEQARATLAMDQPEAADGLDGVLGRLDRHLTQGGLMRHGAQTLSKEPDGTRVRIVGTEDRPELPEGVVTRIVRAAITRGDELIREGAVLTNRRSLQ